MDVGQTPASFFTDSLRTPPGKIKGRLIYQHDVDERTGLCLAVLARNSNLVQILLGAKVRTPSLCVSMDGKGWEAGGGKLHIKTWVLMGRLEEVFVHNCKGFDIRLYG